MNLVAKKFVASRENADGVYEMADAIRCALTMRVVRVRNIYRWGADLMATLLQVEGMHRILHARETWAKVAGL